MSTEDLERTLRRIIRDVFQEELKSSGLFMDNEGLRKIIREEIHSTLRNSPSFQTRTSEQPILPRVSYGYYGRFNFRRQYPGFFS